MKMYCDFIAYGFGVCLLLMFVKWMCEKWHLPRTGEVFKIYIDPKMWRSCLVLIVRKQCAGKHRCRMRSVMFDLKLIFVGSFEFVTGLSNHNVNSRKHFVIIGCEGWVELILARLVENEDFFLKINKKKY